MDKLQVIPKGTLFILSEGEYSDYSVKALCRALVDIPADDLRAEFMAANPEMRERYSFRTGAFIAWLSAKGLFEDVPYGEFYLGDYSDPAAMNVALPNVPPEADEAS